LCQVSAKIQTLDAPIKKRPEGRILTLTEKLYRRALRFVVFFAAFRFVVFLAFFFFAIFWFKILLKFGNHSDLAKYYLEKILQKLFCRCSRFNYRTKRDAIQYFFRENVDNYRAGKNFKK
jgi:hypothetical protein